MPEKALSDKIQIFSVQNLKDLEIWALEVGQ